MTGSPMPFHRSDGPWTIHSCEDHGSLDCVLCGVFDVIDVVPKAEVDRLRSEIDRLKQGLWDCARESGADLDGDETPIHLAFPDIVDFAVQEVRVLRESYEEALRDVT